MSSNIEKRHLNTLASMPCVLCEALGQTTYGVQVHHIRSGQGMGQRSPHWLAIPLCPDCHTGPTGLHGDRSLMRIAKAEELDLLAMTIEALVRGNKTSF